MDIWALADLHLSHGVPSKTMEIYGDHWKGYHDAIEANWRACVGDEDLVLIAGDISWAMHMPEALIDLEWIEALPGQKVIIRGNHDYWWSSISKVRSHLPPSLRAIQNDAVVIDGIAICGSRLWDNPALRFSAAIPLEERPHDPFDEKAQAECKRIWDREIHRLEMSLKALPENAERRICMTHYPPSNFELSSTAATDLLEKYKIDTCIFGHLHALDPGEPFIGEKGGVRYYLTASDYVSFRPIKL
jgi:hypothetical protein